MPLDWIRMQKRTPHCLSSRKRLCGWMPISRKGDLPPLPPLAPAGSPFRLSVWERLQAIPYGQTRTYGELSAELCSSPRAVGGAAGHNPISILIPCHRVLGTGGSLTGYAGGLNKKKLLLKLEGVL